MSSERNVPYSCPRCSSEGSYNGSLRFKQEDPIPVCRHHGEEPVPMEPVKERKSV
jgi:hypothetical protein